MTISEVMGYAKWGGKRRELCMSVRPWYSGLAFFSMYYYVLFFFSPVIYYNNI